MSAPFARRAIERRARALLPWFREYLALSADRTSQALATELQLVAWDREQLYGALQGRVATLAAERMTSVHETPVRILERRSQPLEAVDGALLGLLRDQRVCVELERGTCTATQRILSEVATQLPIGALQIVEQYRDSGDPVAAAGTGAGSAR